MFTAILALLVMPFTDLSRSRGIQFRPLSKIVFYIFVANFIILMVLGAKHVESPFIEFGQISTVIYFAHFLIIVPLVSIFENSLMDLSNYTKNNISLHKPILAGYSIPTLILITIGTVSGEFFITISSSIDFTSLIDTSIKTGVNLGSSLLYTGFDLFAKSIPFVLDKSLDLIVSPVFIPEGGIQVINNGHLLADTLNQISRLIVELADLLREYLNLINSSTSSGSDIANLTERITTIREDIGELLNSLKAFLES
jgi:hypothetical protein